MRGDYSKGRNLLLGNAGAVLAIGAMGALLVGGRCVIAQEGKAVPPGKGEETAYPNDTEGLRRLLQDMAEAARDGENARLQVRIKEIEIPDSANWFTRMLGQEKGESLAATYKAQLEEHEAELADRMKRMARRDVEIAAEKVDAKKLYDAVSGPLDVYLADWVITRPDGTRRTAHIGYFYFIDGKFRWDSNYVFVHRLGGPDGRAPGAPGPRLPSEASRINAAAAPGSYPTCVYCPAAEYTKDALKAKFDGTVLLSVIVQADGTATELKVVKSSGFVSLDEKAIENVRQWRFRPAVDRDGNSVPYTMPIELTYHLYGKH